MTTWIHESRFVFRILGLVPALALAGCAVESASPAPAEAASSTAEALSLRTHHGAVYTITNAAAGNELVVLDRAHDGTLTPAGKIATGGAGSGDGLGSQGAVVRAGEWLFVVNAGSNDVSTFSLRHASPVLVSRTPSGGTRPVSVTVHDRIAYVLNAGGEGNVSGFWIDDDGALSAIEGSTRPLSGAAVGPAQVAFAPDGDTLVVTEKGTNKIDTYYVDGRARAHGPFVQASSGTTPFGFGFTPRGALVVSEAFGGAAGKAAVSAYAIQGEVAVDPISASVGDGQTAACWIQIADGGRFAFTTNAGSGSISSYAIARDGTLTLADATAGVTGAGSHPIDMALGGDGAFLYVLNAGSGTIGAFEVHGGALVSLGAAGALPSTAGGLAAR